MKLESDAEKEAYLQNSEAGTIDDTLVFNLDAKKLQATLTREQYQRVLVASAVLGYGSASDFAATAIAFFLQQNADAIDSALALKAERFNASKAEIALKALGAFKRKARQTSSVPPEPNSP